MMSEHIAAEHDAETGETTTRTMTETELAELVKTFENINIGTTIEPTETDDPFPFIETTNPPPEDTEP